MFCLILTTKTFYLFLTTKTFYSLLTTKKFYFSKTTAATYVRTHSQKSKPVTQPATRIAVRTLNTLARVSHSASQPPNSQMPGVGARATGTHAPRKQPRQPFLSQSAVRQSANGVWLVSQLSQLELYLMLNAMLSQFYVYYRDCRNGAIFKL